MIVQLLNLRFLQIDLMVLVHEFRACVERRLEEIVVLVRGALSEIVNSRLVDQLRGVNAHQTDDRTLYNWLSVFAHDHFFFDAAIFFICLYLDYR